MKKILLLSTLLKQGEQHWKMQITQNERVQVTDDLLEQESELDLEFELKQDSKLEFLMHAKQNFTESSRNIKFILAGQNSEVQAKCLYFGKDKQKLQITTHQEHIANGTTSNVVVKSVLNDQSQIICNSTIHIHKDTQNCIADQINKNILLSSNARVRTAPSLEIKNNHVKSHHGAAVSAVNLEQLFYLESRGLGHETSKNILIDAFLS